MYFKHFVYFLKTNALCHNLQQTQISTRCRNSRPTRSSSHGQEDLEVLDYGIQLTAQWILQKETLAPAQFCRFQLQFASYSNNDYYSFPTGSWSTHLELKRGPLPICILSFIFQGGKESNLPLGSIYVKQVYPNGAAARTKRIREGDRLLAVNGTSLENIKHQEVRICWKQCIRNHVTHVCASQQLS